MTMMVVLVYSAFSVNYFFLSGGSDDDDVDDVCLQAFSSRCWGGRFNETIQIII